MIKSATALYNKISIKYPAFPQIFRFTIAGFLNFGTNFAIVNILRVITGYNKGLQFNAIFTVGFIVALFQSYYLNKNWTFKETKGQTGKKKQVEFSQFVIISIGGLIINNTVVYIITTIIGTQFGISDGLWSNVALVIATAIALVWNFLGYKFVVFKK